MKTFLKYSNLLNSIIGVASLIIFTSIGFQDRLIQGWYQQTITNLNGSTIKDMTFVDSLTGFAVTSSNPLLQQYIFRTTNGGDNWSINYTYNTPNSNWYFIKLQFLNSNTGYAFSWTEMFKTTNRGDNWVKIDYNLPCEDFCVINQDTMFGASSSGFGGGIYRTTNGGYNWENIWSTGGNGNPSKIYMYNKNIGYSCQPITSSSRFRKTTDGGINWTLLNDTNYFDIKFVDSLIGYKVFYNSIKKTTDGGLTWVTQSQSNTYSHTGLKLSLINKDTIWFSGPSVYKNGFPYGVICKTTNGGLNWGYQIPDTSIRLDQYQYLYFTNAKNGWAYRDSGGVHTKTGGNDTTFYTFLNNQTVELPLDFVLNQNYPNPFNNSTIISYKIPVAGKVQLAVYDITGRIIETLINERKNPGKYNIKFESTNISSGIYFYELKVGDRYKVTKKMILLK